MPALAPTTHASPHFRKLTVAAALTAATALTPPAQAACELADGPSVEVARVIAFLASRDADFVNGTTIDVAGGQR